MESELTVVVDWGCHVSSAYRNACPSDRLVPKEIYLEAEPGHVGIVVLKIWSCLGPEDLNTTPTVRTSTGISCIPMQAQ